MNTYTLLRKIHLYTGLAILTFVLMYFVTGYAMIHRNWFPNGVPVKATRTEALAYTGSKDPIAYSQYLRETFDLRGKSIQRRRLRDGGWQFRYSRPGTMHDAMVTPAGDSVGITTHQENAIDTMVGFHRLHGYGGGKLFSVWSLLYDLASFSLVVFAFTGIYRWYKLTKRRLVGWIFLGISYGYTVVTVLYLMYTP
jgi:hypothetical protein